MARKPLESDLRRAEAEGGWLQQIRFRFPEWVVTGVAPPERPEAAEAFAVVGKRMPYIDGVERATGKGKYATDIVLPGMLYGKILRSPHPHAKITRIDTSKAEALPGVVAVLTFKDVPPYQFTLDWRILTDEPRYVGDEIAAVAAVDESTAEEALALIDVEFQVLPFVVDPEEAMKPGAPQLHEGGNIGGKPYVLTRGDIDKGFTEADLVIEGTYRTSYVEHVCLEPHAAVARWEGDTLALWTPTQYTFGVRDGVASALSIPRSKVHVICDFMGAGYGDRSSAYPYHAIAALLARKSGRPVKIELTRDEVFISTTHRYPSIQSFKVGVKRDGTLTAIYSKATAALGAYGIAVFFYSFASDILSPTQLLYRCPNVKLEGYDVYTNTPISGFQRSVGEPQGNFALEVHMDRVAEALGMDPLEFRLKNVVRPEDKDQDSGLPVSSNGLIECLEKGAAAIGWREKWKKPTGSPSGKVRGVGMAALACNKGGAFPPHSAVVKVNTDGSVEVVAGIADIGGGQRGQMAMIAAEELGARLEDVSVTYPDTAFTSDSGGTYGSRATKSIGLPVQAAAADARRQLFEAAVKPRVTFAGPQPPLLEAKVEDLVASDGKIFAKDKPDKTITIAEAAEAVGVPVIGRASLPMPLGFAQVTYGAGFAEVEVDTETGAVKVLRLVQAHDVGRAINPLAVENQIEGGAIQGMGFALMENLVLDKATGISVSPNLSDYKIPTHLDAPEIEAIIVEPGDTVGPFGAKGVGEPPIDLPAPAIANAIHNATRAWLTELPMTPARVREALKAV